MRLLAKYRHYTHWPDRENELAIEDRVSTGVPTLRGFRDLAWLHVLCSSRVHFCNLTFDLFHHTQPVSVVTDFQPARCDNTVLIGAVKSCVRLPRRPSQLPQ